MNPAAIPAFLALFLGCQDTTPEPRYHDAAALGAALARAAAANPALVRVRSLGTSIAGRPLWCVTLGSGDPEKKPALLVAAGVNGTHLVGTEMALALVERVASAGESDAKISDLLREYTLYVLPRVNPDGSEALFGAVRREHAANLRPVDEDRDWRTDEDGPDDVDGDGVITWMRIPDPAGEYLVDAGDPRIVRKADRSKGERGTHKLAIEGLDNDQDGSWNEDGPGGVRIDRNFPHGWREHDRATGTSAVSEPESRALADFLLAHPNVLGFVVFGLHDNVRKAPRSEPGADESPAAPPGGRRRGTAGGDGSGTASQAILRDDASLYERVVKLYKETTGASGDVEDSDADGAPHAWGYFQRGLPSFAVRVWTPPVEKAKEATASAPAVDAAESRPPSRPRGGRGAGDADGGAPESRAAERKGSRPGDDPAAAERARLHWNDTALGSGGFVPWKAAPEGALAKLGAEIGGWKPGVLVNPPASELPELARAHVEFLLALTPELAPKVVFADVLWTSEGEGVATLKASIRNDGKASTMTAMARRTGTVRALRVKVRIPSGEIVVGRPQILVNDLDPQSPPREWTWVVKGSPGSSVFLEVHGPHGPELVSTGVLR